MGRLAQEDHTYKLTRSEYLRCSSTWCLQLNSSGSIAPMATRPDYRAAIALKNHLHRNSEDYQKPIPPQDQDRVREGNKFSETYCRGGRVAKKTGWRFWTSSSSSSSWQTDQLDWKQFLSSHISVATETWFSTLSNEQARYNLSCRCSSQEMSFFLLIAVRISFTVGEVLCNRLR